MIEMNIDEVNRAVDGTLVTGREPVDVDALILREVHSDSRISAHDGLFVAIRGERVDGHDFLGKASANGYVAALVDHEVKDAPLLQILVPDTVAALQRLARHNLDRRRALSRPFTLIGITGSVGKTTTKDLTRALLSHVAPTVAPEGSRNNDIGLPLTALEVGEKTRYFVAEMGANKIGDIERLTRVAPPDVAVELRVGTAHIGEFGSQENIFLAKSELVEALGREGIALLNSDDPRVAAMDDRTKADTILWFGLKERADRHLTVTARDITTDEYDRAIFTLVIEGHDVGRVHLHVAGRHHVINALAAASVAHAVGLEDQDIVAVLGSQVRLSPHRMHVAASPLADGLLVIDDTYNANLDSMGAGLAALSALGKKGAWRVAVLGPMLELGQQADDIHRRVGRLAAQNADELIAVRIPGNPDGDGWASDYVSGFTAQASGAPARVVDDIDEARAALLGSVRAHGSTVALLKGSLASGLEPLADSLLEPADAPDDPAGPSDNADSHPTDSQEEQDR
jgi:UDP-N-acetylmuramoyl-tripeptide--D-alanyl-D-alanine ligase